MRMIRMSEPMRGWYSRGATVGRRTASRYRATHAAGVRAAVHLLRLRTGPSADAAAVRAGDRPAPRGRGGAGTGAGARARRGAAVEPHAGGTSRPSAGSRRSRSVVRRPASARAATCRRSPGCTRRGRWSPAARSGRSRRSCAATSSTPSTRVAGSTTRCPTGRRASASTTTWRWPSPGPRRDGLRVLYVDLDVHHGDGVQAIHWADPGVLTLSIHESGRYLFPGTGGVGELGDGSRRRDRRSTCRWNRGPGRGLVWRPFAELAPRAGRRVRAGPDRVAARRRFARLGSARAPARDDDRDGRGGAAGRRASRTATPRGRWLATGGGGYDAYRVVPRSWSLVWLAGAHREVPAADPGRLARALGGGGGPLRTVAAAPRRSTMRPNAGSRRATTRRPPAEERSPATHGARPAPGRAAPARRWPGTAAGGTRRDARAASAIDASRSPARDPRRSRPPTDPRRRRRRDLGAARPSRRGSSHRPTRSAGHALVLAAIRDGRRSSRRRSTGTRSSGWRSPDRPTSRPAGAPGPRASPRRSGAGGSRRRRAGGLRLGRTARATPTIVAAVTARRARPGRAPRRRRRAPGSPGACWRAPGSASRRPMRRSVAPTRRRSTRSGAPGSGSRRDRLRPRRTTRRRATSSTYRLLEAMRPGGCPICAVRARSERATMDAIINERVLDIGFRADLERKQGFCRRHVAELLPTDRRETGGMLGSSMLLSAVIDRRIGVLRAAVGSRGRGLRVRLKARPRRGRRASPARRARRRSRPPSRGSPSARATPPGRRSWSRRRSASTTSCALWSRRAASPPSSPSRGRSWRASRTSGCGSTATPITRATTGSTS